MKDFLGRGLNHGDHVYYAVGGNRTIRNYGIVDGFTKKCAIVVFVRGDKFYIDTSLAIPARYLLKMEKIDIDFDESIVLE